MQRGFVLATTLIMLLLLSVMALSALHNSLIELRMSMAIFHAYQHDAELSAGIEAGIETILDVNSIHPKPTCWLATTLDMPAFLQTSAWWHGACAGQFHDVTYRYVIETLYPINHCLQYYRITSYLPDQGEHWQVATVLQIDKVAMLNQTCESTVAEQSGLASVPETMLLSWYSLP